MLKFRGYGAALSLSLLRGLRRLSLSSTSSAAQATHSFMDYLVDSLGFSEQQASSLFAKLSRQLLRRGPRKVSDFFSVPKADSIINFFKENGFDQSQIRIVVCYRPKVLRCRIDQTLKPKIDFLRSLGISGPDLAKLLTVNPELLFRNLSSDVLLVLPALRELLGADENVVRFLKKLRRFSLSCVAYNMLPNIALLRNYGIPIESIRNRIILQPSPFLQSTKSFEDILIRVEEKLGIRRDSLMFLHGVHLLACLSEETIDSKCQVFKSFGWTELQIRDLIRRNPYCLVLCEARIKKKLDFLVNKLGYEPANIVANVSMFTYSLEKRIVPRHRIFMVLKDKGLIMKDYSLRTLVQFNEASFVKKFVLPFKELHEVYADCTGRPVQLLTQGKAATHPQT